MELVLLKDFSNPLFCNAFKKYFREQNIDVKDWNGLFAQMNEDHMNFAFMLIDQNEVVGFIQFKEDELSNWFFKEKVGFIREFWIMAEKRNQGLGSCLLDEAEKYFLNKKIHRIILTSDPGSQDFYIRHNYHKCGEIQALNDLPVYVKII